MKKMLILFFTPVLLFGSWSEPQTIAPEICTSTLLMNSEGQCFCFFVTKNNQIEYSVSSSSNNWSKSKLLYQASDTAIIDELCVALDKNDLIHLAWIEMDETDEHLIHAPIANGKMLERQVIDTISYDYGLKCTASGDKTNYVRRGFLIHSTITFDTNNNGIVTWSKTTREGGCFTNNGAEILTAELPQGSNIWTSALQHAKDGVLPKLFVNGTGEAILMWEPERVRQNSADYRYYKVRSNSGHWEKKKTFTDPGLNSSRSIFSAALTENKTFLVALGSSTSDSFFGSPYPSLNIEQIDAKNNTSRPLKIKLDGLFPLCADIQVSKDGNPVVGWIEAVRTNKLNLDIKVARFFDDTYHTIILDTFPLCEASLASALSVPTIKVAVDKDNYIHVVWIGKKGLTIATYSGNSWCEPRLISDKKINNVYFQTNDNDSISLLWEEITGKKITLKTAFYN